MALRSDDSDIRPAWLQVELGGNGDYYLKVTEEIQGLRIATSCRISTSGGNAPLEVRTAIAELFRALEKSNLNEHPD